MIADSCSFETDRLTVGEWHSVPDRERQPRSLPALVVGLMTEPVTRWLPSDWRGPYTLERAGRWIAERDSEGTTLLVLERSSGQVVGLVMLAESVAEDDDGIDVRLGYLLAETAWGRGIGSELVRGLIGWSRRRPSIRSLAGGVAAANVASARVLEKNGFTAAGGGPDDPAGERLFELKLSG